MSTPAQADASHKLRLVLDYVPCEVCLAEPTKDQEILCSICARLHRHVGVTLARRTSVIVERPEAPQAAEPVVIPPAAPETAPAAAEAAPATAEPEPVETPSTPYVPPQGPPPVEVHLWDGKRKSDREGHAIEVIVEPYAPPPPPPPPYVDVQEASVNLPATATAAAAPLADAAAAEVPAPAPQPEASADAGVVEADEDWDDIASFEPADDAPFDFTSSTDETPARAAPPPEEPAAVETRAEAPPAEQAPEGAAQDDFVFRPPDADASPPAAAPVEDEPAWTPEEEVPVEPEEPTRSPWAPPNETDFLSDEVAAEEAPEPEPEPEPAHAPALAEPEPEEEILETEIVEMEIIEDDEDAAPAPAPQPVEDEDEIVEMEIIEDDEPASDAPVAPVAAAPSENDSDLYRLRGFGDAHFAALQARRIESLSHLSGHDPNELAEQTGLAADLLVPWVQVADLVTEVGVPTDAAIAMVAAGVPGPRGLADMDEQTIVDRVQAFGNASISARDVKRWKRRV